MSVRKAQNRIRKRHGIGKGKLHERMSAARSGLANLACRAQWPRGWSGTFHRRRDVQRMHDLVDQLGADSVISRAYVEAEKAARGPAESSVKTTRATIDEINKRSEALRAARKEQETGG